MALAHHRERLALVGIEIAEQAADRPVVFFRDALRFRIVIDAVRAFADINLLGIDFCSACNISLWYDYKDSMVELYFGRKWSRPLLESKLR